MSLAVWLGDRAQRHPNRIAVIDVASGRRHSYQGFDDRANQIAHFCDQWVGLLPGDRLGLLSAPSDDVLQIVVSAAKLGLTALLLDPDAPPDVLIAAVNEHSPRTVFYGLAQADLVQDIWFEVDSVEHFIPLRGAVDTANFEDIVAHYPPLPPSVSLRDDVPWVYFTVDEIAWSVDQAIGGNMGPQDELPAVDVPLHSPTGLAAAVRGLRSGHCVVVEKDSVAVIESPAGMQPTDEADSASQRNVPRGRSWLPHEFM